MSEFNVNEYLQTYGSSAPQEMKSNTMVLFFAFRDGEGIKETVLKNFHNDIYTDKVLENVVSAILGGKHHGKPETIEDYIYKFLKKSWEFCLESDDIIKELVRVETNFIKKENYTDFYIIKYKTADDKMNEVVLDILMDLDCCSLGGYVLKSAEDIVL